MSFLLDSHVFLWFDRNDLRLPSSVRQQIEQAPQVFFSVASVWELSIKRSLGKLPGLRMSPLEMAPHYQMTLLSITAQHAELAASLPRHHRDPFDHMLIAQAQIENVALVTHDKLLAQYDVPILLV